MNSNEQWILNNLADFSDLKSKNQDWPSVLSVNNGRSANTEYQFQLENNEKLLKNFKQLKDKLKVTNKENHVLKSSMAEKQSQVSRCKTVEKQMIKKVHEFSKQNKELKAQNQQFKQKLKFAKDYVKSRKQIEDELQMVKVALIQHKQMIKSMQTERRKSLQLSIVEKLELQEKIKKAEATMRSDHNYIQDMQVQLHKVKQQNLKLQSQLKKLQIKYDEEVYNKKWVNNNYQKEELQRMVKQMEIEISNFNQKHNKEKQRKFALEKRVLQLQQISGIWTVKAQTYENEIKQTDKKIKKYEKKMNQALHRADQASSDSIHWEQRFLKCVGVCQQLIARVKRQMIGDLVSLAKSCQFKIIKLKQQDRVLKSVLKKSPSATKNRSLSKGRSKSVNNPNTPTRRLFKNLIEDSQYPKYKLEQKDMSPCLNKGNQTQIKRAALYSNRFSMDGDLKFLEQVSSRVNHQKIDNQEVKGSYNRYQNTQTVKKQDVDSKIRREREQMQRKLRQKMMYNRLQFAGSSPQRHYLRSEYLKMMDI